MQPVWRSRFHRRSPEYAHTDRTEQHLATVMDVGDGSAAAMAKEAVDVRVQQSERPPEKRPHAAMIAPGAASAPAQLFRSRRRAGRDQQE
jgi:hypothetical protein